MVGQVFRLLWNCGPLEIVGSSNDDPSIGAEYPRHQSGVAGFSGTDHGESPRLETDHVALAVRHHSITAGLEESRHGVRESQRGFVSFAIPSHCQIVAWYMYGYSAGALFLGLPGVDCGWLKRVEYVQQCPREIRKCVFSRLPRFEKGSPNTRLMWGLLLANGRLPIDYRITAAGRKRASVWDCCRPEAVV